MAAALGSLGVRRRGLSVSLGVQRARGIGLALGLLVLPIEVFTPRVL